METTKMLLYLVDGGAESWRVSLAARALLAKVILKLPCDETSLRLIALRDSI